MQFKRNQNTTCTTTVCPARDCLIDGYPSSTRCLCPRYPHVLNTQVRNCSDSAADRTLLLAPKTKQSDGIRVTTSYSQTQ